MASLKIIGVEVRTTDEKCWPIDLKNGKKLIKNWQNRIKRPPQPRLQRLNSYQGSINAILATFD